MTDLRKAAEMALEALEIWEKMQPNTTACAVRIPAIQALRQALEEPEQEQKTPLKVLNLTVFTENRLRNGRVYDVETLQAMTNRDILAIPDMGKKALKEVMEALDVYAVNMSQERVDETAKRKHEPEKEVTITCSCGDKFYIPLDELIKQLQEDKSQDFPKRFDTHPAPPKREWVGLTDEAIWLEYQMLWPFHPAEEPRLAADIVKFSRAIEAKLKEKNT